MRAHSLCVIALAGCNALTGVGKLEALPDDDAGAAEIDARAPVDGGGDARVTDAFVTDSPASDADAASFCPTFAVFCDDLETGNLIKWTSLFQTNGGKVTVADAPVYAGKKAMRALAGSSTLVDGSFPAVAAGARITIPAVTSGMLVVHARVYMPITLTNDTTFIKVFGANAVDDMNVKIGINGVPKVDGDTPNAGAEKLGMKKLPTGSWVCVEWQTTVAVLGHQKLLVGSGIEVDADEDTSTSLGFDSVQLGFQASNGSITQEVLFDDVVIATQPVGCP